jgi:hypothetical protein
VLHIRGSLTIKNLVVGITTIPDTPDKYPENTCSDTYPDPSQVEHVVFGPWGDSQPWQHDVNNYQKDMITISWSNDTHDALCHGGGRCPNNQGSRPDTQTRRATTGTTVSLYLSIYLSIYHSIYQSPFHSITLFIYLSFTLSLYLSISIEIPEMIFS